MQPLINVMCIVYGLIKLNIFKRTLLNNVTALKPHIIK